MKKTIGAVFLILFLTSVGSSMGFSLKLTGDAAFITSGDYNDGIEDHNAYIAAFGHNVAGVFSRLNLGMDFGAELVLDLNDNFGIGLGVGYLQFTRAREQVDYDWDLLGSTFHHADFLTPNIYAIPLTLNLHYDLPLGRTKVGFFGGLGYYLMKMKIESGFDSNFFAASSDIVFESNSVGGRVGFQGGLGLEIPLGGDFAFVVDVTGRYVRLSDIRGDYTQTGTLLGIPFARSGNDTFCYTEELKFNGVFYKMNDWITDAAAPADADYRNVRHGNFDLSGVSGRAGFKINF